MGFIDTLKIVTVITEAAHESQPYHILGKGILEYSQGIKSVPLLLLQTMGQQYKVFYLDFQKYFEDSEKFYKNDAARFLVMWMAYQQGIGKKEWDWKEIRELSHRLYKYMENDPNGFRTSNLPAIQSTLQNVQYIMDYDEN